MRRKTLLGGLFFLALLAATTFTLLRKQSPAELIAALSRAEPPFLLAGLLLMCGFVLCEAVTTRILLAALGSPAPLRRCAEYAFAGFYFSSITPLSAGGQPMQIVYMARDGIPAASATLVMLFDSVLYQVTTVLYAVCALVGFPALALRLGRGIHILLLLGGGILALSAVVMLGFLLRPALAERLSGGVLNLLCRIGILRNRAAAADKLAVQTARYRTGTLLLQRRPALLPVLLLVNAAQLTLLYLVPVTVYAAFGLHGANVLEMIATQALLSLAVACLPLPGAVGAAESAFLRGFALYFGAELVTPAVLAVRGINFYLFLLFAGVLTLRLHLRRPTS